MKKIVTILLAAIVSLSLISFGGCNGSKNELGFREEDAKGMIEMNFFGSKAVSYCLVNEIALKGEEGSEFVCSTRLQDPKKEGLFLLDTHSSASSVTVASGTSIYWSDVYYDGTGTYFAENETIWLEFINRKDSNIIGYAVVRLEKLPEEASKTHDPTIVKAVTFPKTLGIFYQNVTEEQVGQLIKNAEK